MTTTSSVMERVAAAHDRFGQTKAAASARRVAAAARSARAINLNGRWVSVRTLDEGRALWLALRDSEGLGASDMVRGCGDYREDGRLVARVSYNGRMWTPTGEEIRG